MSFIKIKLKIDNTYKQSSKFVRFEDVAKGRKGAVLVDCKTELVPIIRTTTKYNHPAQQFTSFHLKIINQIKQKIKSELKLSDIEFNNALIEIYDSKYTKMGFHTDQALDIKDDSFICLFSCYENDSDNATDHRKLVVQNKTTGKMFEIVLDNNSAVLFSTLTNHQHKHKIILNVENSKPQNKWLGITLRMSKTFVQFIKDNACFTSGALLKLANNEERKKFYFYKGRENANIEYTYPEINFTISKSDLVQPAIIENIQ
jgi:hypothetical protein